MGSEETNRLERRIAQLNADLKHRIEEGEERLQNRLKDDLKVTRDHFSSLSDSANRLLKRELQTFSDKEDQKLVLEIEKIKADLHQLTERAASRAVQERLRQSMLLLSAFVAGLTLFLAAGFITQAQWMPWVHDTLKSPDAVYADFETNLGAMSLDQIQEARDEMPSYIVHQLGSNKDLRLEEMFSSQFLKALGGSVRQDLARLFASPMRVDAADVEAYGRISLGVRIVQIGKIGKGERTACGRSISNGKLQAIIVIPRDWPDGHVPWLGCSDSFPNVTLLTLTVAGAKVSGVMLQGLQRDGRTDVIEARVTRSVARKLGIEGAKPFTGLTSGNLSVSECTN